MSGMGCSASAQHQDWPSSIAAESTQVSKIPTSACHHLKPRKSHGPSATSFEVVQLSALEPGP